MLSVVNLLPRESGDGGEGVVVQRVSAHFFNIKESILIISPASHNNLVPQGQTPKVCFNDPKAKS